MWWQIYQVITPDLNIDPKLIEPKHSDGLELRLILKQLVIWLVFKSACFNYPVGVLRTNWRYKFNGYHLCLKVVSHDTQSMVSVPHHIPNRVASPVVVFKFHNSQIAFQYRSPFRGLRTRRRSSDTSPIKCLAIRSNLFSRCVNQFSSFSNKCLGYPRAFSDTFQLLSECAVCWVVCVIIFVLECLDYF